MSAVGWVLWLMLSAALVGLSVWHYRRRETPGRGRTLLALLRASALALVLLLLFDPQLRAGAGNGVRSTQVLLDASLSMQLDAGAGITRWERAVQEARSRAGSAQVLLFGDAARPVDADALPDSAPGDGRTQLLPALQAAAEAGVPRVVVITDGGIEDIDAVARWLPRLGIAVETVLVGDSLANRSLAEVSAPQWVDAGEPVPVEIGVTGAQDSAAVVVSRDGRVIARSVVPGAAAGRMATGRLELRLDPASTDDGWVRLDVALEDGGAVADDDRRTLYVQVGDEPAGIALVSFRPDWEPRFLAPLLERSLGLPLRAYLRGATGQYVTLAGGLDAGAGAMEADVQRAVERGQLVVLHGLGVSSPAWAHEAAATARHVMIFPAPDLTGAELPVNVGSALQGDFFPSTAVPASPIAALLQDVELSGITPLPEIRPVEMPADAWSPLMVTRGRQGATYPLIAAGETGGRRWVVALASGYWQWAFRGGTERTLYSRLWSALGGWLAGERDIAALPGVRPARMTIPRAAAVPWVMPGIAADSVHVTLTDGTATAVLDTVILPARRDTAYTAAPRSGHFSYRARAFHGDSVTEGAGVMTVEQYSPELARRRADIGTIESDATMIRGDTADRRGTPLHATAYPYILLVVLLAAEWILRRRWGLR